MQQSFNPATTHKGRESARGFRSTVMNFVTALTVNAAIVLSTRRSTPVNPAPMVLRVRRRLIDDLWHEGEYVAGDHPSIAVVPLEGFGSYDVDKSVILNN